MMVFAASLSCTKKGPPQAAPGDSVEVLREKIAKNPSYENHIALGLQLGAKGQSADAIELYKKATQINDKGPLAWNNLCAEMNAQKRFAEAIQNCERAIALEPNFEMARNNLKFANEQMSAGKVDLIKRKQELLAMPKPPAQDLINLGMEYFNSHDYQSSVEIWRKVKSGDPLYATAQNNMASSLILLSQFGLAEKAIKEALKLEPNNQLFANNKKWLEEKKSEKK